MKVGDLVKQRKTVLGGPSPLLVVSSMVREGHYARVWFRDKFWLLKAEKLEVINESR